MGFRSLILHSRISWLVITVPVGILASSCSDPPTKPPVAAEGTDQPTGGAGGGSGDGGNKEGGSSSSGGSLDSGLDASDAGSCTTLENGGGVIDLTAVADTLPAGTGGTIEDGTYVLTDAKVYVGNTGQPGLTNATYQVTFTISGGSTFERALLYKNPGGVSTEQRGKGAFIPNGVTGTISLTCPQSLSESVSITVLNNTVTLGNTVTKEALTFTKKP